MENVTVTKRGVVIIADGAAAAAGLNFLRCRADIIIRDRLLVPFTRPAVHIVTSHCRQQTTTLGTRTSEVTNGVSLLSTRAEFDHCLARRQDAVVTKQLPP